VDPERYPELELDARNAHHVYQRSIDWEGGAAACFGGKMGEYSMRPQLH
jgi:hypothetical protein